MGEIAARAICEHYPNGGTKTFGSGRRNHSFELHRPAASSSAEITLSRETVHRPRDHEKPARASRRAETIIERQRSLGRKIL